MPTCLLPRVLCVHPSAPITPSPFVQCALSRLGKDRLHGHLLLEEPRASPVLEIQRVRAPATPARSRTFSPARRSPPQCAAPHHWRCSAFSCPPRALRARSLCCRSFPPSTCLPFWQARRRIAGSSDLACRQLPHRRNRRNGSAQKSPVCCREQQTSPRWNSASLTAVCPDRGTAASSEHRGRQGIKLTTDSGSVWMQAPTPRGKDAPCATDSLTTCYETPAATWIETHDAARARGCWRSSHDGQLTVLYCVPTNPGPRSFHAWPVRRYCWGWS